MFREKALKQISGPTRHETAQRGDYIVGSYIICSKTKEDLMMGERYTMHRECRLEKSAGKTSCGRSRHWWEDIIKTDLKDI
jgi:hypothetical protein